MFSEIISTALIILAVFILCASIIQVEERRHLAEKVFSDRTCFLVEETIDHQSTIFSEIKQVYKCVHSTYEVDYDLRKYK